MEVGTLEAEAEGVQGAEEVVPEAALEVAEVWVAPDVSPSPR